MQQTHSSSPSDLLTVPEVAEKLRKSQRFVLDQLRAKNLRGSRYGGAWHVSEADLNNYVSAKANVAPVRGRTA